MGMFGLSSLAVELLQCPPPPQCGRRPARRARRLGTLILPLCARGARLCAQCNVSIEEMDGKITGLANTVGPSPREN